MLAPALPEPSPTYDSVRWCTYHLFGFSLTSDFPFANRLAAGSSAPDLTFTCVASAPVAVDWAHASPLYSSPYRTDSDESVAYLYQLDACDVLRFTDVADFFVWPDFIACYLVDSTYDYMVEIRLLGPVLSFWLEKQGIPALHASAVVCEQGAVAFLSSNRGGKSSLAASLMQAGYPLLTDDILPVEHRQGRFFGHPGYPQMRLWPDEAEHFLGQSNSLEHVHPELSKRRVPVGADAFGTFCSTSQLVSCVYLPERREPADGDMEISIRPVAARDAVIELVRHSFSARMVEAAGLQAQRLNLFAQLARQVPMRRVLYPSGLEHLDTVRDVILKDMDSLQRSG